MNPKHTIPNAIAGELTLTENGKEQTPNLCVREKDVANKTVEENMANECGKHTGGKQQHGSQ